MTNLDHVPLPLVFIYDHALSWRDPAYENFQFQRFAPIDDGFNTCALPSLKKRSPPARPAGQHSLQPGTSGGEAGNKTEAGYQRTCQKRKENVAILPIPLSLLSLPSSLTHVALQNLLYTTMKDFRWRPQPQPLPQQFGTPCPIPPFSVLRSLNPAPESLQAGILVLRTRKGTFAGRRALCTECWGGPA